MNSEPSRPLRLRKKIALVIATLSHFSFRCWAHSP